MLIGESQHLLASKDDIRSIIGISSYENTVIATSDKTIYIYDKDKRLDKFSIKQICTVISYNSLLAVGQIDGYVYIYKIQEKKVICNKFSSSQPITHLVLKNDLLFVTNENKVKYGNLQSNKATTLYQSKVTITSFDSDFVHCFIGQSDGTILKMTVNENPVHQIFKKCVGEIQHLRLSNKNVIIANESNLLICNEFGTVIWQAPFQYISSLSMSPNNEFLAISTESSLYIIDMSSFLVDKIGCKLFGISSVCYEYSGQALLVGTYDGVCDRIELILRSELYKDTFLINYHLSSCCTVKNIHDNKAYFIRNDEPIKYIDITKDMIICKTQTSIKFVNIFSNSTSTVEWHRQSDDELFMFATYVFILVDDQVFIINNDRILTAIHCNNLHPNFISIHNDLIAYYHDDILILKELQGKQIFSLELLDIKLILLNSNLYVQFSNGDIFYINHVNYNKSLLTSGEIAVTYNDLLIVQQSHTIFIYKADTILTSFQVVGNLKHVENNIIITKFNNAEYQYPITLKSTDLKQSLYQHDLFNLNNSNLLLNQAIQQNDYYIASKCSFDLNLYCQGYYYLSLCNKNSEKSKVSASIISAEFDTVYDQYKSIKQGSTTNKQLLYTCAEQLERYGFITEACDLYVMLNSMDLAINLCIKHSCYSKAISLMDPKDSRFMDIRIKHLNSLMYHRDYLNAYDLALQIDQNKAFECSLYINKEYVPSNPQLLLQYAEYLYKNGLYEKAADIYSKVDIGKSVSIYCDLQLYNNAIAISKDPKHYAGALNDLLINNHTLFIKLHQLLDSESSGFETLFDKGFYSELLSLTEDKKTYCARIIEKLTKIEDMEYYYLYMGDEKGIIMRYLQNKQFSDAMRLSSKTKYKNQVCYLWAKNSKSIPTEYTLNALEYGLSMNDFELVLELLPHHMHFQPAVYLKYAQYLKEIDDERCVEYYVKCKAYANVLNYYISKRDTLQVLSTVKQYQLQSCISKELSNLVKEKNYAYADELSLKCNMVQDLLQIYMNDKLIDLGMSYCQKYIPHLYAEYKAKYNVKPLGQQQKLTVDAAQQIKLGLQNGSLSQILANKAKLDTEQMKLILAHCVENKLLEHSNEIMTKRKEYVSLEPYFDILLLYQNRAVAELELDKELIYKINMSLTRYIDYVDPLEVIYDAGNAAKVA
eukprot:NODE_283_length_11832_cov_0.293190.p1 type:complete len:1162 gc:universal NODE_283_length_11832_cov_0.293190:5777-2292(-)